MHHDMAMTSSASAPYQRKKYRAPTAVESISLTELMELCGRKISAAQRSLFQKPDDRDPVIFCAGDLQVLRKPCVSVIGARAVSDEGKRRARKIAAQLAAADVVVTSGLAKGVDVAAHSGSIDAGGRTVAVIGTPLDKAYPAEHASMQELIYSDHLLVSQFPIGTRTFPSDFPKRNRLMAAITDASIIVEASDTSGTLHQAAECVRLNRWLFIMKSVAENPDLDWPRKFLREERVAVLTSVSDVIDRIA